jgi:hypothetical protein
LLSSISFGNYYLLLLVWFPFMASEPSSCDLCMHTTWGGNVVTRTLLFHTYYSCAGSVIRSCTHNHTIYSVCSHGNQHICFNPTYHPREQWLEIKSVCNPGNLVSHTLIAPINQCLCSLMHVQPRRGYGGTGCVCGGLAWERAYMSNDKCICGGDSSWPCDDVGSYYCPFEVVFMGHTAEG